MRIQSSTPFNESPSAQVARKGKPRSPALRSKLKVVNNKRERVVGSLSHIPGLGPLFLSRDSGKPHADAIVTATYYGENYDANKGRLLICDYPLLTVERVLNRPEVFKRKSRKTLRRLANSTRTSIRNAAIMELVRRKHERQTR